MNNESFYAIRRELIETWEVFQQTGDERLARSEVVDAAAMVFGYDEVEAQVRASLVSHQSAGAPRQHPERAVTRRGGCDAGPAGRNARERWRCRQESIVCREGAEIFRRGHDHITFLKTTW